ncbi:MAG: DUF3105 domain-containing protein [Chloroflexi bacterium]|nr:DUF3105 domain-containing protein [Chloroflexota bacterium]
MAARQKERRKQADRRTYQREQRRERSDARKRRRRFLYLGVSAVIAVMIIASFAISSLPGRGAQSSGSKQAQYKEGVGAEQVLLPSANHVDGRTVTYTTIPPTSGDHWGITTQCGFYTEEVRDETVMHNMEHGNVIMSYNLPDAADVTKLRDIHNRLKDSQDWLVTRPYAKLAPGEVALTVWGVLDRFTGVDEERIKRFFDTYKGNLLSPETKGLGQGIPCTTAQRLAP